MRQKSSTEDQDDNTGTITAKDVQELSEALSVGNGRPDVFIIDQKAMEAYTKAFYGPVPTFNSGDWVFDGIELFEVIRQNSKRLELARLGDFTKGGILAIRSADELRKVPKGSTLQTVKILYGKKK